MGIRGFAKYLARYRIGNLHGNLSEFTGQEFVIDGLNCIYGLARKHRSNIPFHFDALCSALSSHNIHATIVYDGPPDRRQIGIRRARSMQRLVRQKHLASLQSRSLSSNDTVAQLEWQLAEPDRGDVNISRTIAADYGFDVIDAVGEADITCALLSGTKSGVVISSDTDLIAYRTPTVIYDLHVTDGCFDCWDYQNVIHGLGLTADQLEEVFAVMSDPQIRNKLHVTDVLFDAPRHTSLVEHYECIYGTLLTAREVLESSRSIRQSA